MITDNLSVPTLIVDEAKCRSNIRTMAMVAKTAGIRLRPHFKTHQSCQVARWMKEEGGISCCAVSSLAMACYFADEWKDISVAFPFNKHEIKRVNELVLNKSVQLGLTVENEEAIEFLASHVKGTVRVWVKVDAGYHRTGVPIENLARISKLLKMIDQASSDSLLQVAGVLLHSGHSYNVQGPLALETIHQETLSAVAKLRAAFQDAYPELEYSVGDTPCCSTQDDWQGCTELRPGNFVFYDVMQYFIGSNSLDQIAVCMACPVVAEHPERNHVVLYGGAVHFSKDAVQDDKGNKVYGLPVSFAPEGWGTVWPNCRVVKLSQEHGIVEVTQDIMETVKIGDWVGVLPIHSCLTADSMGEYLSLDGTVIGHFRSHRIPLSANFSK